MKNLLLCLGTLLIATPFVLLCLYALTPTRFTNFEQFLGAMAFVVGLNVLVGIEVIK
jgi:hypothetical protein